MTADDPGARPDPTPDLDTGFIPWTAHLPHGSGYVAADLEHHAPLPRIGDALEYIDEAGGHHWYRVIEVVHTLQSAADTRPAVADGEPARAEGDAEPPGSSGLVRAGLPRVYFAVADPPSPGGIMDNETDRQAPDHDAPDPGAYIGRKPEFAAETIPGGVGPDDERVSAGDTQSSGAGATDRRVQGRENEAPHGHREGPQAGDADVREAGKDR
jgi:hypothetical protein